MQHTKNTTGFTLIELSIVIVIIGLIVGGIFVGQDLIQQARIRASISQVQEIETTINAYRLKYNAIPGDHKNAYDFFGAACQLSPANCNGDGTSFIDDSWVREYYLVWWHIRLAGFRLSSDEILALGFGGGRITSQLSDRTSHYIVKDGGYYVARPASKGTNMLVFTEQGMSARNDSWQDGGVTPYEAMTIDRKMDDAKPTFGRVVAEDGFSGAMATSTACLNVAEYDLNIKTYGCWMGYYLHN